MTSTVKVDMGERRTKPRVPKYGGMEYVQGNGPVEGQCFACLLVLLGVIVFILSLWLLMPVDKYYATFAQACVRCSWNFCYLSTCYYTKWWARTWPLSEDALPFKNATGDSTVPNGNGEYDYPSLIVTCCCGAVGSLLAVCCTAPQAVRRGGPARLVGTGVIFALICHTVAIIYLGVEVIGKKEQWVFNAFKAGDPYVFIDQSVASYWSEDSNYVYYGNIVFCTFGFMCALAFVELLFFMAALCADDKYTGTRSYYDESSGWGW